MTGVLEEIKEIPLRAEDFLKRSGDFKLPLDVPYVGMGSSFFAATAFKYMGYNIQPEIASELFNYIANPRDHGVILSQSGESTESVWCADLFKQYVAITNQPESSLATKSNVSQVVHILAGEEKYSSSKTFVNTLLALFKGFGVDTTRSVALLREDFNKYEDNGRQLAESLHSLISSEPIHGVYILGSGPNVGTAMEAALILSECTKRAYNGMALAQYDHGPKETARGSIVIQIISEGPSYKRSKELTHLLHKSGAHVFEIEEKAVEEHLSVLHNIVPFNFCAYYLAEKFNVTEIFSVGGKVTTV